MRTILALAALLGTAIAAAQVASSANMGCKIVAPSGMSCNGISVPPSKEKDKNILKLFITDITLEPGAALEQPTVLSDCLVIGIKGGDLLNEKAPFLHVDLGKESVTLMPREQPFRLRNKGSESVEFRLIEIRR